MGPLTETPQNGLPGLKHWRYDLMAGLQVALVSLPLSLGIAIASGAPPVTGVISAIIAGLIFPFLGGAYVTISGPAAGLAPALLAGMIMLGNGDLAVGYPLLLVAICLTGLVQIVMSHFGMGRFAIFLPITVVEAMLASIGLMIIIKQIPALLGNVAGPSKSMIEAIGNLPQYLLKIDLAIAVIGAVCLFLMFYLNRTAIRWLRMVPPPLFVAAVGIVLGIVFQLNPKHLISMPADIISGGFTLPAFGEVLSRPELWTSILLVVITLTLIDGVESLATIKAVDKIDPFQRKSDPNVTLRAMGVSNTLSSIAGGLTIIPGGIKSRANIDAGGRTLWANFYNAVFLITFLFLAKDIISRIPLAAIAAILVYVGWRLCEVKVFSRTLSIGRDQMIVFLTTIVAVLSTDLLSGILIGIAMEVVILVYLLSPSLRAVLTGRVDGMQSVELVWRNCRSLFRSPVIRVKSSDQDGRPHYEISLSSVVCFNLLSLDKVLAALPRDAGVHFVVTESGRIIDHTGIEYIHQFQEECLREGRPFSVSGLEKFYRFTNHSLSARMQDAHWVKEKAKLSAREEQMAGVAERHGFQFSRDTVGLLNKYNFVYLRRGDNRQQKNIISGVYAGLQVEIFDYTHTASPHYQVEHAHTLLIARRQGASYPSQPLVIITPGHYLQRYLVQFDEMTPQEQPALGAEMRAYALDRNAAAAVLDADLARLLANSKGCYVEIHHDVMLVFRPGRELESARGIARLLGFADWFARGGQAQQQAEELGSGRHAPGPG
jgi:MFS superfamily sulfate permease-like transporter